MNASEHDLLEPTDDTVLFPSRTLDVEVLRRPIESTTYASEDYQAVLEAHGITCSMSRRGNCYDNAAMESFWSTLKLELVYRRDFQTRAQGRSEIFDYIELFYNRQRSHSALNFLSPVDFELQNN